jgi:MFS family permease
VTEQPNEAKNRWWLVAAVGLAVFMAVLDTTIIGVALPVIGRDFGKPPSVTEWVVLGYSLPMIALLLPTGRWLDTVGRRPALVFGTAGFALASAAAGAAQSIEWLIAARAIQGCFGSVLFAVATAIAATAVRPEVRGRAMGIIGTIGPLGGITGPPLGGLLVDTIGWPWVFYVNIPASIAVIAIGFAQLPAGGRLRLPDRSWLGEAVVLGAAAFVLMLALSLGSHQPVWLALIVVAVPLLLIWRRMPASETVRSLFRAPGIIRPHLALLASAVSISGTMFIAPFYLQQVLHISPTRTGLTLLAFPVAIGLIGVLGGMLADRWGARPSAILGSCVALVALALLIPLGTDWTPADVMWRLAIGGLGAGLFNSANMTLAISLAPQAMLGTTGASTSAARQLGLGAGPALVTVAWALGAYSIGGMRTAIALTTVVSALSLLALVAPALRRSETERILRL